MKSWQCRVMKTGMYGTRLVDFLDVFINTIKEYGTKEYFEYSKGGVYPWIRWANDVRVTRGSYGEIVIASRSVTQENLLGMPDNNGSAYNYRRREVSLIPPVLYREFRKIISLRPRLFLDKTCKLGSILNDKLTEKKLSLAEFFWCLIKLSGLPNEVKKLDGIYKKRMGRVKVNPEDFEGTPGSNFIASAIQDLQKQIVDESKNFADKKNALYAETWKKYEAEIAEMRKEMDDKILALKNEINALLESEFEGFVEKKEGDE